MRHAHSGWRFSRLLSSAWRPPDGGVQTGNATRERKPAMTIIPTTRSLRATDRTRNLFVELEHAQRRLLEMQLGVPTAAPRRTGMPSQIDHR